MESEKLLIVGMTCVIVVVGLIVVAGPYLFLTPTDGNNNSSGTIPRDVDLLNLSLEVPDWNLLMSDNSTITMYELHSKFVIIDLMTTWYFACALQNSELLDIYNTIDSDSLVIISLTVDDAETTEMMAEYKSDNDLPWAHGHYSEAALSDNSTSNDSTSWSSPETCPSSLLFHAQGDLQRPI